LDILDRAGWKSFSWGQGKAVWTFVLEYPTLSLIRVCWKSFSVGVGGWGLGVGGWGMGFTDFQVVNYLIFREKVPEFSPWSLPCLVLFDWQKV
jgi:hypothetical protein